MQHQLHTILHYKHVRRVIAPGGGLYARAQRALSAPGRHEVVRHTDKSSSLSSVPRMRPHLSR